MGKIAFVFSGQGAQYSGMGKDLFENVPAAQEVFRLADASRPGTSVQCFEGTADELAQTRNTQPCMLAMSLAAAAGLTAAGVKADMTAGFSLGEISALIYSGAVSFQEGFRLVCLRGDLMQRDAEKAESGMAAVVKLGADEVERICSEFEQVYPVNYNCPGQISVAGLLSQMDDFSKSIKAAGGRAIPLKVRGGFHSPFMAEAAGDFGKALESVIIEAPKITLYSDFTGLPYEGDAKVLLSRQIGSPVRWQSIIEHMARAGVDTFVELGPGRTLCGLISKTIPGARVFGVEDSQSLKETAEEILAC